MTGKELTEAEKKKIDDMSIFAMLELWRFSPIGSDCFTGPYGEYFACVMNKKRDADPDGWVSASKTLGWG